MENLEAFSDDEYFMELVNLVAPRRRHRVYRERENHFEKWRDSEFVDRFRLTKAVVRLIVGLITDEISNSTNGNHAVSAEEKVLLTLRFFATGSMMIVAGDFLGLDKSTASRIIHEVSRAIANLSKSFIKMPLGIDERWSKMAEFYQISRFPQCIGAVDCTHIKIQSPGGEEAETFRNQKGAFSINVQVVGDAHLQIQNIVCRWPGSSYDSTIFNNSRLRRQFESGEFGDGVLVGDSGYPIKAYLITPLAHPVTPVENLFNEAQIRTRNPIERLFGVWKRRFPVLALGLRVKQENIEAIVVTTAVLHNIARKHNLPEPPPPNQEILEAIQHAFDYPDNTALVDERLINNITRINLIQNHFTKLLE